MATIDGANVAQLKRFVVIAAAVLAAVAGFVNSVFIILSLDPVSHVTGSLSQSGVDVTTGDLSGLAGLATVLVAFFTGAIAAGAVLRARPQATGRRYGVVLLVEAALLGAAPLVVDVLQLPRHGAAHHAHDGNADRSRRPHRRPRLPQRASVERRAAGHHPGDLRRRWHRRCLRGGHSRLRSLWGPALCCTLLGLWYVTYRHRQHLNTHTQRRELVPA